ncbi:MAG: D-alanyl-D-alanine carboxypeptidase/D-alanyl-D-alanine-endopeptidase [Pseudomonadota bacterium]|nr:D-alanyl-D-alanine carboxypeptidase/D-alanyl-D-alanine-endopeptidase [Pseudomonadota bacterium]
MLTLAAASPAAARTLAAAPQQSLQQRVEARLSEAGAGVRFGLVVVTEDGRELVAIAPDARFIPASNTKIFTTAAAFATLPGLDRPDVAGGATVRLEARGRKSPDVILKGYGDSRMSSAPDCIIDCLAVLADAVMAAKVRAVHDIVGDASFYPDERWSPGMSWNNLHSRYGTAASALTLDDNELTLRVSPGVAGAPPVIEAQSYYEVDNRAVTTAAGETKLDFARAPGGRVIRVTGNIPVGAKPEQLVASIDDPAHYAAWRLKALLETRGVRVTGAVATRYRFLAPSDDPLTRIGMPKATPPEPPVIARLAPSPLLGDLSIINKDSQNLHAELMLRRVGRQSGSGTIADGVAMIQAMLARAGVPRAAFDFADGSGMSTYNRLSPRGTVTFLRWIAAQPWGAAWKNTLPIGGVDGTLARRFLGTSLEGRVFAKSGTLNATNALSGTMIARSGRSLFFSAFANDVPEDVRATKAIDDALVMIAEAN